MTVPNPRETSTARNPKIQGTGSLEPGRGLKLHRAKKNTATVSSSLARDSCQRKPLYHQLHTDLESCILTACFINGIHGRSIPAGGAEPWDCPVLCSQALQKTNTCLRLAGREAEAQQEMASPSSRHSE